MKELEIGKTSKIKFSLDVFISIVIFVFTLGMARSSINAKQNQMIAKLDEVSEAQKQMVVIRDNQHTELDKQIAWIVPTLNVVARKLGLQ